MSMYKLNGMNMTHSTGSFLNSAPVELTSIKGYQDFIAKQKKLKNQVTTQLSEDKSVGYVLNDSEVLATVSGEAKEYLLALSGEN
ncbi:hypothetical protein KDRO_E05900 [Kluyveromyces lactis]|nr:hypothetical protein KDRO_E05900 [Kluyveromyces lactis]